MSIGAGIGFLFGVVMTLVSLLQFNEEETNAGEVLAVGLLVGVPIAVVMGTFAGFLWDQLFKQRSE